MFQFQNGAIKRKMWYNSNREHKQFQFQNGAIKRLVTNVNTQPTLLFQFQNGAIKSREFQNKKILIFRDLYLVLSSILLFESRRYAKI